MIDIWDIFTEVQVLIAPKYQPENKFMFQMNLVVFQIIFLKYLNQA